MMRRLVSGVFGLVLSMMVTADTTNSLRAHPDVAGALAISDAWIEGVRQYEDVPGISVGFVVDQQLLFSEGYGYANVRRKRPADADTLYSICSISKLFTSIAVLQQRDRGQLSLRDPVAKHLDWFDIDDMSTEDPVRVEGLLTHSSGLPRESDFPYWMDEDFPFPTREQLVARLGEQQMLYQPATHFQYSNLGFSLAGEVVSATSGQEYAAYVQGNILDPLEMTDTRTYFPEDLHGKQMAIGYRGKLRNSDRSPLPPFDTRGVAAAAGFTSSVNDLVKFASWQFRTTSGKDETVLRPATLREMQRVHWVDPDWKTTWGLGFIVNNVDGTTVVGHGGGCPGYITSLILVPKHKIASIVLTNASDGPAYEIGASLLKVVGEALQKAVQAKQPQTPADGAPDNLEDYEGNFGTKIWGGETAVRRWGSGLAAVRLPSDDMNDIVRLKHDENDVFLRVTKDGEPRERWQFQRDDDGVVVGVKIHSNIYRKID